MPNFNGIMPLKKDATSTDAGYAGVYGQRGHFNDSDNSGGVLTVNSNDQRECVLVKNDSGTTLSAGQALKFTTFGLKVTKAGAGDRIHGFVGPVVDGSATNTVASNAYFWMVVYGPTSVLADTSTITAGDPLVASGTTTGSLRKRLQGLVYSDVAASTAVSGTTVATVFDKNFTFSANTLQAGDVIRVFAQAIATATNSTDTLTLDLMLGSQAVLTSAAVDVANSDIGVISADIVIRTTGASGTFVGSGFVDLGTPGTATTKTYNLASTAIDTTASQQVGVRATWSTNNAGNSCRLDILDVQLVRSEQTPSAAATALAASSSAALVRAFANCQW